MKKIFFILFSSFFLLASMVTAAEFSADMIMEMPMGEQSGKIYHKSPDISRTDMMGMTNIIKHPLVYQLFDGTRKYVVTDLDELSKENPAANIRDFDQFIKENNFKKVGSDSLQGYKCDIYEGEILFSEEPGKGTMSVPMKLWYSKKLDYALRTESTLPPPMEGTAVTYVENIRKSSQPASLFEIPSGYTKAESIQEAMGIGGSMPQVKGQMPSAGEMPSEEEMDKMMKMLQDMMKKSSQ